MISLKQVEAIHSILIDRFGGPHGVRDQGSLESALARPYLTFDGKELYPTPVQKAAAIFESIVSNHPFVDGNKRTAYVLLRLTLLQLGCDLRATEEEKYIFTINAASGRLKFNEIGDWIEERLIQPN